MAQYSIKDLENFTQIKAHTLRIWEQRYNLLQPERTETNIRFYTDYDLKKILNIVLLYSNGMKISKIAQLTDQEIFEKAEEILLQNERHQSNQIDNLIKLVLEFDDEQIQFELGRITSELGMDGMFTEILIPTLEKVGYLWQTNAITVSHEHFFSNLVRDFMIVQIDRLKTSRISKGKVALFLNEKEKHELSLLFYYYILKSRGYDCFYLGQSVPMKDLKVFFQEVRPDYGVTSMINELNEKEASKFFENLGEFFDLSKLYVGGIQSKRMRRIFPKKVKTVNKLEDLSL